MTEQDIHFNLTSGYIEPSMKEYLKMHDCYQLFKGYIIEEAYARGRHVNANRKIMGDDTRLEDYPHMRGLRYMLEVFYEVYDINVDTWESDQFMCDVYNATALDDSFESFEEFMYEHLV